MQRKFQGFRTRYHIRRSFLKDVEAQKKKKNNKEMSLRLRFSVSQRWVEYHKLLDRKMRKIKKKNKTIEIEKKIK